VFALVKFEVTIRSKRAAVAIRGEFADERGATGGALVGGADFEGEAGGLAGHDRSTGVAEVFEEPGSDIARLADEDPLAGVRESIDAGASGGVFEDRSRSEGAGSALCKGHDGLSERKFPSAGWRRAKVCGRACAFAL
jgi:hypothetical protein